MSARVESRLVMGCHPTVRGFGWAVLKGPYEPIDWGLVYLRGDKDAGARRKLSRLLDRYRPDALMVEAPAGPRTPGVTLLATVAASLGADYGVEVRNVERARFQKALGLQDNATREDIAKLVAERLWALGHRLPRPRRPWQSADRRLALFGAAALAMSYWRMGDR